MLRGIKAHEFISSPALAAGAARRSRGIPSANERGFQMRLDYCKEVSQ